MKQQHIRIHKLVLRASAEGQRVLIAGEADHPEVIGIGGWCSNLLVFSGPEELEKWVKTVEEPNNLALTVVSQTTLIRAVWESSLKILKKECQNKSYLKVLLIL